ncbi:hypothetical protein Droror1_Dr00002611 [Drosera rotundifolia]
MDRLFPPMLYLISVIFCISIFTALPILAISTAAAAAKIAYVNYVKAACNSVTYPPLCYASCSPYAYKIKKSPLKLANYATISALSAAKNADTMVARLAKLQGITSFDAATIRDCIEVVGDGIYELRQSMKQMATLGQGNHTVLEMAMSNVKTWMSAALTDEDTCMDGVGNSRVDMAVRSKIRGRIVAVAELTSNALALINQLPV